MNRIHLFSPLYTQRSGHRAKVTPRFSASAVIYQAIDPATLDRNKGIAIYGGNTVKPEVLEKARYWARVFAENGFHVVTGGGEGAMEAARRGAHDAGGVAIGTATRVWNHGEKARDYDYFTLHDTISERFEGPGSFYECAACHLLFPGGLGTKHEASRVIYDMIDGTTSHPIQQCMVIADIDPEFTQWVESQPHFEKQYIKFVKTPEEALAIFRANEHSILKTKGLA